MKICQPHWTDLKVALELRGIGHLGAKTPQDATRNVVTELEGRGAENDYDPLMACNNMIFTQAIETFGLAMLNDEDGTEKCPVCAVARVWIDGPANEALAEARKRGLVK